MAHGVAPETAERIGAWWESKRGHVQPSEFILNQKGRVLGSMYSSSPVGRMDPGEALKLIEILGRRSG